MNAFSIHAITQNSRWHLSPNFMHSDYCYEIIMKTAIEKRRTAELHVIPIILRPIDLGGTLISELQVLPINGIPITKWRNRDEAFGDVAKGIREVVGLLQLEHRRYELETTKGFLSLRLAACRRKADGHR
jgi:hypothetical protein